MSPPVSILKFQLGPVQDFIAAARSSRDLWSGSYLLSFLVAAGIRKLQKQGGELIFPNPDGQPLLSDPGRWKQLKAQDQIDLLTPNLPNLFVAKVPSDQASEIAKEVNSVIKTQWDAIADAVWEFHSKLGIEPRKRAVFDRQVKQHLSIAWQITSIEGTTEDGYTEAYRNNGWHLDAVRQTRQFDAIGGGQWSIGLEKDSLNGKDASLCGGTDFAKEMENKGGEICSLFKHADYVGAITLIKRTWHLAYLKGKQGLNTDSRQFPIRSIPAIAARADELDDDRGTETAKADKYLAAIAFDGDSIGKWVNGDFLPTGVGLVAHHSAFSQALSKFALKRVRDIVEEQVDGTNKQGKPIKVPLGLLIYAGGDDVVALVPADVASLR